MMFIFVITKNTSKKHSVHKKKEREREDPAICNNIGETIGYFVK